MSDGYDPEPAVLFGPITSHLPVDPGHIVAQRTSATAWNIKVRNVPGRTYLFPVRATDASGKMAIESYEYAVVRQSR